MTFPNYDGATKWHIFRNSIPTRKSKMAAAKPVTNIFQFINDNENGGSAVGNLLLGAIEAEIYCEHFMNLDIYC